MRDKMLQLPINISFFLALDQRDYKKNGSNATHITELLRQTI